MKKTPLMVALAVLAAVLIALPGCSSTVYQTKKDRIQTAMEEVSDPDKVHFEYHRDGDDVGYWHWRCSGDLCPPETLEPVMVLDAGP